MIRKARTEDIEALSELRIEQQKAEMSDKYDCDDNVLKDNTRMFLKEHLNKDYFMFLIEDKEIMATAAIQLISYMPLCTNLSGKKGYISNVYTKKNFQGKGLQKLLLKEVINFAKINKVDSLELGTSNPIAIKLYNSFGFQHSKIAMSLKITNNN